MFKLNNFYMSELNYKFTLPPIESISVTVANSVEIYEMDVDQVLLEINRTLNFGQETDSYVSVSYIASIQFNTEVDEAEVKAEIEQNISVLNKVFSKASLTISQITDASPFGIVVTNPMCKAGTVKII